jgi:hypothetical protein
MYTKRWVSTICLALLIFLAVVGSLTSRAAENCAAGGCLFLPVQAKPETPATPRPSVTPTTPRPTPIPGDVVVKSYTSYTTTFAIEIYGEVVNNTDHLVYPFNMHVHLYDASDQLIASAIGDFFVQKLEPGQTSPFVIAGISTVVPRVTRFEFSFEHNTSSSRNYQPLTILSQVVGAGRPSVSGMIRNDNAQTMRHGVVSVTYYDAAGRVIDVAWAGYYEPAPGVSQAYEVVAHLDGPSYASYAVRAQGHLEQ